MGIIAVVGSELAQLIQLGLGVGAFGLVVWIVRTATTKTIPDMQRDFKEMLLKQQKTFEDVSREQRKEFRDILEADRARHLEREKTILETLSKNKEP